MSLEYVHQQAGATAIIMAALEQMALMQVKSQR
jgi:hypothetical protein